MKDNIRQKKFNEQVISLQGELIPIVSELLENGKICFSSTPAAGDSEGNYWKPISNIKGDYIYKSFDEKAEWVIEANKKIADDYQKVISEYFRRNPEKSINLFEAGKKHLFGKLLMWGGSIVEEGLMSHEKIVDLAGKFEKVVQKKRESFFGCVHGNIIGDHVFIGEDKILYLLGMRIVSRPGKGYYDFLRSLDWLLLKTDNEIIDFDRTVGWMKQYLQQYDWEEVKLVFSLRCMGILGWDMLHRGDFGKGDFEKKKKLLLKFIEREY